MTYVNRLSDYFFVLGRWACVMDGEEEQFYVRTIVEGGEEEEQQQQQQEQQQRQQQEEQQQQHQEEEQQQQHQEEEQQQREPRDGKAAPLPTAPPAPPTQVQLVVPPLIPAPAPSPALPTACTDVQSIVERAVRVSHQKTIAKMGSRQGTGGGSTDIFVRELVSRICTVLSTDEFDEISDSVAELTDFVHTHLSVEKCVRQQLVGALGRAERPLSDGGDLGALKATQFVAALIGAVGSA
jgi:signal recognition particle GTPase